MNLLFAGKSHSDATNLIRRPPHAIVGFSACPRQWDFVQGSGKMVGPIRRLARIGKLALNLSIFVCVELVPRVGVVPRACVESA